MKRFLAIAVFVTVAVLGANAHAQQGTGGQGTGLYIGGHLGSNFLANPDIEQSGFVINTTYDPGESVGGFLGYDFGYVRVDGEIAFRNNNIIDFLGIPANGSAWALSYMANGYIDLIDGPVQLYIGGGIGVATVSLNAIEVFGFLVADDSDSVFAYQISGGIGFEIFPRSTFTLSYRYFATEDAEMEDLSGNPFTAQYKSHEFNAGIRIMFN